MLRDRIAVLVGKLGVGLLRRTPSVSKAARVMNFLFRLSRENSELMMLQNADADNTDHHGAQRSLMKDKLIAQLAFAS
jgi:hypothetical protein